MNEVFASFLHILPTLLGTALVLGCLIGFWRGLSLKPKDSDERAPGPRSAADVWIDAPWNRSSPPRWLKRFFASRD